MRRALLPLLPALTRFTYGALNPLTIDRYTLRELNEYRTQYREWLNAREVPTGGR